MNVSLLKPPSSIRVKKSRPVSTSHNSDRPTEIENYYPKERKYKSSVIGEIRLDRSVHRLSTPILETYHNRQSSLPLPLTIETNSIVSDFLEFAKTPLRKKKDFRYCLMRSVKDLYSTQLPIQKISEIPYVLPTFPYAHLHSRDFLKACKFNEPIKVKEMLENFPNLVYSFDELQMTALHWASLRNYLAILKILIINHAIIDMIDGNHRTPLFIACKNGHVEAVRILLINKADPTIPSNSKKTPLKVSKNPEIIEMLKKILIIRNHINGLSKKQREEQWKILGISYLTSTKK